MRERRTAEMTTLIRDRPFLNLAELNQRRLCAFFRPLLGESHINLGKGVEGSFPAIQHPPQQGDNETQTGLKVQKPFLSHWEHVLDAHSSSFVLYVAICAGCWAVCARQVSAGTIGITGAGGSWSASSEAIWAWWQAKLSTAETLGTCK